MDPTVIACLLTVSERTVAESANNDNNDTSAVGLVILSIPLNSNKILDGSDDS